MKTVYSCSSLPQAPAVYALYGGDQRKYVAYVGVADKLRSRIEQHVIRRDSSVATGTSAVGINPEYVTELRWWESPRFAERAYLEASEIVAFDVFNPALRSRQPSTARARELAQHDAFHQEVRRLFAGEPTGCLVFRSLREAIERIAELEDRIAALERKFAATQGHP
jgi:hypothetical protein